MRIFRYVRSNPWNLLLFVICFYYHCSLLADTPHPPQAACFIGNILVPVLLLNYHT